MERIYDISTSLIYRWIYKYSKYNKKGAQVVEMKDSNAEKIRQMEARIKELISQADIIRGGHPGCGVEKLYETLKPQTMGRDKFCEIFMDLGYRVRRIKKLHKGNYSSMV